MARPVTIDHSGPQGYSQGPWLALPEQISDPTRDLAGWLGLAESDELGSIEEQLANMVNAHAKSLPYPATCLVVNDRSLATGQVMNLLTVITILAKSSDRIYRRDRDPHFGRNFRASGLVLILPNGYEMWR